MTMPRAALDAPALPSGEGGDGPTRVPPHARPGAPGGRFPGASTARLRPSGAAGMAAIAFALLLAASGGRGGQPPAGDRVGGAVRPGEIAMTGPRGAFDGQIRAQTVFAADPRRSAALDPDRDGLACEALPPGVAPTLWAGGIPEGAEPAASVEAIDGDTIAVRGRAGRRSGSAC